MEYEAVIGLEVHVQIRTKTKMFTSVEHKFAEPPNTLTDPVIWAFPGVLPVLNFEAIKRTIELGLMLGCKIPEITKWDRKNYFYPDSPKNYQLSQYDQPLCLGGGVEIELPAKNASEMGEHRIVHLTRIHLEEDVGKLTHFNSDSLVDYNRAGTPLMEIVSEPDMHSSEEVFAYLTSLKNTISCAGISDCDMEKGQMRCDVNVSVRPKGSKEFGVKVEMKNINSISNARNSIDYEIKRQIDCLKKGVQIVQETRRWDAQLGITQSMRSKEDAHDYRYFPDPDLMPVKISAELLESIKANLPERPFDRQRRYMSDYSLPYSVTSVMCHDNDLCSYFERAVKVYDKNPKAIANMLNNDLLRELASVEAEESDSEAELEDIFGRADSKAGDSAAIAKKRLAACKITPETLAGLVKIIDSGVISKQMAKDVFVEMFKTGKSADEIVAEKGLAQNSDSGELEKFCLDAMAANPKAVEQFKGGNEKAINALIGPVMKASKGKANPAMVLDIMKKLISK